MPLSHISVYASVCRAYKHFCQHVHERSTDVATRLTVVPIRWSNVHERSRTLIYAELKKSFYACIQFSCRLACAERITIYAETRFNNARWTLYVRTGRSLNVQRTFVERSLSVGETHSFVQNHALTLIERPASDHKAS